MAEAMGQGSAAQVRPWRLIQTQRECVQGEGGKET